MGRKKANHGEQNNTREQHASQNGVGEVEGGRGLSIFPLWLCRSLKTPHRCSEPSVQAVQYIGTQKIKIKN